MVQALSTLSEMEPAAAELLRDVQRGLLGAGQKTLPCKYLYDEVGTLLFEAICALPEYGLTRADERLLRQHAVEMTDPLGDGVLVAELGSGSARKTRWILQALCRRQPTHYWPIEISPLALRHSQRELAELSRLDIEPVEAEYLNGLDVIVRRRNRPGLRGRPLLLLFLGSTLGNFDPSEATRFLRSLVARLKPGDGLLLGLDLVKPAAQLRRAYDDAAGVTAAFNKNLLARLNRELDMNFDLRQWRHRAVYRARERRVEMHLRARTDLTVQLPGSGTIAFARGETIWTESSHKFHRRDIARWLRAAGLELRGQWQDSEWPFVENLALVN